MVDLYNTITLFKEGSAITYYSFLTYNYLIIVYSKVFILFYFILFYLFLTTLYFIFTYRVKITKIVKTRQKVANYNLQKLFEITI